MGFGGIREGLRKLESIWELEGKVGGGSWKGKFRGSWKGKFGGRFGRV